MPNPNQLPLIGSKAERKLEEQAHLRLCFIEGQEAKRQGKPRHKIPYHFGAIKPPYAAKCQKEWHKGWDSL